MYGYRLCLHRISGREGCPLRIAYGLELWQYSCKGEQLLQTIKDLSPDRTAVLLLAMRCTAWQLHPLHLADVIEDFLAQG